MLTAQQVENVTFSTVRLGLGYNMAEVDDLLDQLGDALRDYEKGRPGAGMTADQLADATFAETKLREGYKPDEIDEFLREAIETLRAYEATVAAHGLSAGVHASDRPAARPAAPGPPAPPAAPAAPVPPAAPPVPPAPVVGEQPAPGPVPAEAPLADVEEVTPIRRPSGYSSPPEEGLRVDEVVHRLQSLQSLQDGGTVNAPLQVRTPDGRTFTVSAVKSSPSGLVITLAQ